MIVLFPDPEVAGVIEVIQAGIPDNDQVELDTILKVTLPALELTNRLVGVTEIEGASNAPDLYANLVVVLSLWQ